LAAATIFPVLVLGIFTKTVSKEGAIAGMLSGLIFTLSYILWFKFISPELDNTSFWLCGISPEGIGILGAGINFLVSIVVSQVTRRPPKKIRILVQELQRP